jgi:hypothetical protein
VRDPVVGALLGYLGSGDPNSALAVSSDLYDAAKGSLWAKLENPYAAAAGGYVLLRTLRSDTIPDWYGWPRNLATWFRWLPDGAVICGWQQLLLETDEGLTEARDWFLKAVDRGIPVFTEGVRLLLRGLTAVANAQRGVHDASLDRALRTARAFGAAVDITQPVTTYVERDIRGLLNERAPWGHTVAPATRSSPRAEIAYDTKEDLPVSRRAEKAEEAELEVAY